MSTPIAPSTADKVEKKVAQTEKEVKKDAKSGAEKVKEAASKASKTLKENASKASKKADTFFKKVYASISDGVSCFASTTKSAVLTYPIAASNITAIVAAGLTTLLFQTRCPKCSATCSDKHLYGSVGSIVVSTLAVVDSFALYYAKNHKQLKD